MKLIFIRHGETDFNKEGKINGQEETPLNDKGIRQAERLVAKLPTGIDLFFTSPLKRAKQTAEIINKKLDLKIELRDELKEINFGSLAGHTWEEIDNLSGKDNAQKADVTLTYNYRSFGGEDVNDVKLRLLSFIQELRTLYMGQKILIVTHAGIMRIMHSVFSQKNNPNIDNTAVHIFEI